MDWSPYGRVASWPAMPDGCSCAFWQHRNARWADVGRDEAGTLGWWCPEHGVARPVLVGPPYYERFSAHAVQRAPHRQRIAETKQQFMQQTLLGVPA